jgi:hypothetical protein
VSDVLDGVRASCARVAARARSVRIDDAALERWVAGHAADAPRPGADPAHHRLDSPDATLAYVLTLDAVNFGSGWFPHLRKRPGCSGYFTIATRLRERFEREGAWSAQELRRADVDLCETLFEQRGRPEVRPLLALFARALCDLGTHVLERHGGRFAGIVEAAEGSAAGLVAELCRMPLYRDTARYDDFPVSFYKRAQITASDLAAAFEGKGPGRFRDLDRLTIFADNLVPHVLRREGVLVYAGDLAARIDREELVPAGSAEEVEIRALAVHAAERIVEALRARGVPATARDLDAVLWGRGQDPDMKAQPRHRTRSAFY